MNVIRRKLGALILVVFLAILSGEVSATEVCFEQAVPYLAGYGSRGIAASDLDGDGFPDLAVANWYAGSVSILVNEGDGTFASSDNYVADNRAVSVCAADLDADGDLDLAVACDLVNNNVLVFMNAGDGTFAAPIVYTASNGPASISAVDMDGDNCLDLVLANETSEDVSVLMNRCDGTFEQADNYPTGDNLWDHCTEDLNGDGFPDVAAASIDANDVSVLINNGDATLAAAVHYPAGDCPTYIECADLDQDEDIDLIVTNCVTDCVLILMNNGDGTFALPISYPVGNLPFSICTVDIDKDGDVDLAVTNDESDDVSILVNDGDGTFGLPVNFAVGDGPRSVCAADMDGDDKCDLVVANFWSGTVSILRSCSVSILAASLDIKPGSCPNPLNTRAGNGCAFTTNSDMESTQFAKARPDKPQTAPVLPVAILGTMEFDVSDIVASSVLLEGISAARWNVEDVATPIGADAEECECNDFGPDGYMDLTLKFSKAQIIQALGEVYDGDVIPLTISGELADGTQFEGTDCVVIIGGAGEPAFASTSSPFGLVNYPNPFNPTTEISFSLPVTSDVKLEVFNIMGQHVATLVNEHKVAGNHTITWDSRGDNGDVVSSGVYFYRLTAGDAILSRKMMLLK